MNDQERKEIEAEAEARTYTIMEMMVHDISATLFGPFLAAVSDATSDLDDRQVSEWYRRLIPALVKQMPKIEAADASKETVFSMAKTAVLRVTLQHAQRKLRAAVGLARCGTFTADEVMQTYAHVAWATDSGCEYLRQTLDPEEISRVMAWLADNIMEADIIDMVKGHRAGHLSSKLDGALRCAVSAHKNAVASFKAALSEG